MRRNKLNDNEKKYIIESYSKLTAKEIAIKLGCSVSAIHSFADRNNLTKITRKYNTGNNWTEKELSFLKENYEILAVSDIATKLNRTKWAVTSKKLALKKQVENSKQIISSFIDEDYQCPYCKMFFINMSDDEVSFHLNTCR